MIKHIYENTSYYEAPTCRMTIYGLENTELYKRFRKAAIDLVSRCAYNSNNYTPIIEPRYGCKGLQLEITNLKQKCVNLGYYQTSMKITVTELKDGE